MKRMIAFALALLLLPYAAALAEPAGSALGEFAHAFPAVTVTGALTVDRDAAREALGAAGIPEDQIGLWDGVLALLENTEDRLVIADEGFEYSQAGGDGETLTVAGEIRGGKAWIVSSLLPGVVLTAEASGRDWVESAAAADAIIGELNRAMEAVAATVTEDAPVPGSYEIDGEAFDTCVPLNIDAEAMAEAGVELARSLAANEALRDAGLDALSVDEDLRAEPSALPAISAARYSAEGTSATVYTAELIPADEEIGTIHVAVREDGDEIRVKIDAADQALEVAAEYIPTDHGANLRVNVRYEGNEWALFVDAQTGETAAVTTELYFNDMDAPLATEINTFALDGARTISIDPEGKATLDIQELLERIG